MINFGILKLIFYYQFKINIIRSVKTFFVYKQCLDEFLYMFIISSEMVWIGICLVLETLFLFFHGKTFDGW